MEQKYRVQQGTEVMNKINLQDINLTYQATSRISLTLTVPLLFASRRSNNSYYTTTAAGLGDTALVAQGWLWNPRHAKRGNISIGFGMQAPTGKDNVQNNVLASATATTPTVVTDDYSIQPGSGGWGIARKWGYVSRGVPRDEALIVVFDGNFHGRTTTIVSFSSDPDARADFGPYTPGFVSVPYGDLTALSAVFAEYGHRIVAVLVEPIQGEAGVVVPPPDFLPGLRTCARRQARC